MFSFPINIITKIMVIKIRISSEMYNYPETNFENF